MLSQNIKHPIPLKKTPKIKENDKALKTIPLIYDGTISHTTGHPDVSIIANNKPNMILIIIISNKVSAAP